MAAKKKEDLLYGVHDKTSAEQALKEAGAGYEKSQAVQDAQKQLEQYMESKPGGICIRVSAENRRTAGPDLESGRLFV